MFEDKSAEMKSSSFNCKNIGTQDRKGDVLEYDTAYVRTTELSNEPKPHYNRGIYKIATKDNSNYILRKIKGKSWANLNEGDLVMDYGSLSDLGYEGEELPTELKIVQVKGIRNELKYFKQHPKEDIKMAYRFFVIAFWIGVASMLLGIVSILATILGWKIC